MTLRTKTLIVVGITLVSAAVLVYVAGSIILPQGFREVERQEVYQNVERARFALSDDLAQLDSTARDRATRNDAYEFISNGNRQYIEGNLTKSALAAIGVDIMLCVNRSGRVVFGEQFDAKTGKPKPAPAALLQSVSKGAPLQHPDVNQGKRGVIILPDGLALVAARPILPSSGKGPVRGTLVIGRILDTGRIREMAGNIHLSLAAHRFDPRMPSDAALAGAGNADKSPITIRPLSEDLIAGYTLVKDIYGEPALVFRVDMPRDILEQGRASMRYLGSSVLVVGLSLILAILLLLERMVLSRLGRLSSAVKKIGTSGDVSARVSVAGNDELADLAGEINRMLKALQTTQDELEVRVRERTSELAGVNEALRESEARYRHIVEAAYEGIWIIDADRHTTFVNRRMTEMLGYSAEEMMGQPLFAFMDDQAQVLADGYIERRRRNISEIHEFKFRHKDGTDLWTLMSAVPLHDDEGRYAGALAMITDITDRKRAEGALEAAYARERRIADVLQRALTPEINVALVNYGIAGDYKPALNEAEVGGDFYDIFKLGDGRLAIVMGDVSGKGLQAAVYTSMARYTLRAYANEDPDPALVMERLNRTLCDHTPNEVFITVFYGVLDPNTHTLIYANAGHDEPLLHNNKLGCLLSLAVTGRAAGIVRDSVYEQQTFMLSPGDVLLVYTDGIMDSGSEGSCLDKEGLSEILAANAHHGEDFIVGAVLAAATDIAGGVLRDDAAIVVVKARIGEDFGLRNQD